MRWLIDALFTANKVSGHHSGTLPEAPVALESRTVVCFLKTETAKSQEGIAVDDPLRLTEDLDSQLWVNSQSLSLEETPEESPPNLQLLTT